MRLKENELKKVSIVMPVFNEAKYIENCIESLLTQTYPKEMMEWIFVDGCSTDNTVEIINKFKDKYKNLIKVFTNDKKIVPYAMNIGIEHATGEYIIRLDAHADYKEDYIENCVYYLNTTDADNVGGIAITKGRGLIGETIARMLSSKFGVGNSKFRTENYNGYVDTVPFGAFRAEIFKKIGLYNTKLIRNQDNELNYRIRKNGGKIYLSSDIVFSYYSRDSIKKIMDMGFKNGKWNIITMKLCPGTMGYRHFVPFAFLMSLLVLIPLAFAFNIFKYLLIIELIMYGLLDIIFSAKAAQNIKQFFILLALFPMFHLSYGAGSLVGLLNLKKIIRDMKD